MQINYIGIWKLHGANGLAGNAESFAIADNAADGVRATIVSNPAPYFHHIDRSLALLDITAHGGLKIVVNSNSSQTLAERAAAIHASRKDLNLAGAYLVIERQARGGEINPALRRDADDFSVCFDGVDKKEVQSAVRPFLTAVMSAVTMNLKENAERQFSKIGEVVFLTENDSAKPIYTFSYELGTPRVSVASPLDSEIAKSIARDAATMATDASLYSAARLLIGSLDRKTDALQAFLDAWTALEIFVNKTFSDRYEGHWHGFLSSDAPAAAAPILDKLRSTMRDKYRLSDKFLIIAATLTPDTADDDLKEFVRLKRHRDRMLHGEQVIGPYPTDAIQKLLERFMRLHLRS